MTSSTCRSATTSYQSRHKLQGWPTPSSSSSSPSLNSPSNPHLNRRHPHPHGDAQRGVGCRGRYPQVFHGETASPLQRSPGERVFLFTRSSSLSFSPDCQADRASARHRAGSTSSKHPARQAHVRQAQQEPDRQGQPQTQTHVVCSQAEHFRRPRINLGSSVITSM